MRSYWIQANYAKRSAEMAREGVLIWQPHKAAPA